MKKAVFLDRDGTINVEKHYLHKIEDFEFLPGVIAGLKILSDLGFVLIVVTNQSGIGRGYYSESDFALLDRWMKTRLLENGIIISKTYYCPHLPNAPVKKYDRICNCRKPGTGLYDLAAKDYNLNINLSYAIGDKIRDCSICKKTDCKGFLIGRNESEEIIEDIKLGRHKNIQYCADLLTSAKIIKQWEESK